MSEIQSTIIIQGTSKVKLFVTSLSQSLPCFLYSALFTNTNYSDFYATFMFTILGVLQHLKTLTVNPNTAINNTHCET